MRSRPDKQEASRSQLSLFAWCGTYPQQAESVDLRAEKPTSLQIHSTSFDLAWRRGNRGVSTVNFRKGLELLVKVEVLVEVEAVMEEQGVQLSWCNYGELIGLACRSCHICRGLAGKSF